MVNALLTETKVIFRGYVRARRYFINVVWYCSYVCLMPFVTSHTPVLVFTYRDPSMFSARLYFH